MLREKLKEEINTLNEEQLKRIADFIAFIEYEYECKRTPESVPFWQKAEPAERAQEFRKWVNQLPQSGLSLPDEALSRDIIYE